MLILVSHATCHIHAHFATSQCCCNELKAPFKCNSIPKDTVSNRMLLKRDPFETAGSHSEILGTRGLLSSRRTPCGQDLYGQFSN